MELKEKVTVLQNMYAAAMVDTVVQYVKEGVIDKVIKRKDEQREITSAVSIKMLGVTNVSEVFTRTAELFGCASWSVTQNKSMLIAETKNCKMFEIARKMNAPAPCRMYCLDPIRSMVKKFAPEAGFEVEQTLFTGGSCRVKVI